MGDPTKDYYKEQLAAWSNLSAAAVGYPAPHHGLNPAAHSQVSNYAAHPSYLHQVQQNFSQLSQQQQQQSSQQQHRLSAAYDSQNKNMHRLSNGGQTSAYSYPPADQYHRPLPAHSSVPNPTARNTSVVPPSLPVPPAHMRSHPYQPTSYSQHLAAPYNPYQSYGASPYHAPLTADKRPLAPQSQVLNGSSSSYYHPQASDPKDFSRRPEKSAPNETVKNLSISSQQQQQVQQHQQQQQAQQQQQLQQQVQQQQLQQQTQQLQQQLMSKTSTTSYTYPYNYHQNLYSGQQPQYSLPPYTSVQRPPTTLPSQAVEHGVVKAAEKVQDRPSNKVAYSTQRPSFESEKPSNYSSPSSATVNEIYNSLNLRSDNGYAPPPTTATSQHQQQPSPQNNLFSSPQMAPSVTTSYLLQSLTASQFPSPLSSQHLQQQQKQPQPQQQPPASVTAPPSQHLQAPFYPPQPQQEIPSAPITVSQNTSTTSTEADKDEDAPLAVKRDSWKRKSSSTKESKQKYFKKEDGSAASDKSRMLPFKDDPYAFNDDDDDGSGSVSSGSGSKDPNGFEFGGKNSKDKLSNPVYKFKNALLTRTAEMPLPGSSSSSPVVGKINPLAFNSSPELFADACDKFIEDLQTRQFQFSRRASLESWRTAMAVRTAEKERKKSLKLIKKESLEQKDDSSFEVDHIKTESEEQVLGEPSRAISGIQVSNEQYQNPVKDDVELNSRRLLESELKESKSAELLIVNSDVRNDTRIDVKNDARSEVRNDVRSGAGSVIRNDTKPDLKEASFTASHVQTKAEPVTSYVSDVIEKPKDVTELPNTSTNNNETKAEPAKAVLTPQTSTPPSSTNNVSSKKGQLWALPIVPKLPQKPPEKRPNSLTGLGGKKPADILAPDLALASLASTATITTASSSAAAAPPLADVWRLAFGAAKTTKKGQAENSGGNGRPIKQEQQVVADVVAVNKKTFLDIPPEVRRRPKPSFGGLIHFSPDWERAVRLHHERCKLPAALTKRIQVNPKILRGSQAPLSSTSSAASPATPSSSSCPESKTPSNQVNKYASLSSYLGSPSDSSDTDHTSPIPGNNYSSGVSDASKNVVETILENRKKLRNCVAIGRMFRNPALPQKKRYNSKGTSGVAVREPNRSVITGLMPTPGMPLWMESDHHGSEDEEPSTSAAAATVPTTNPFGNFRRKTLLRYLGSLNCSPEVKAQMLDWKPEVYETKTRRQAHQIKAESNIREIFGSDPPTKNNEKKTKRKRLSSSQSSRNSSPVKKEIEESPVKDVVSKQQIKRIKITKDSPQKLTVKAEKVGAKEEAKKKDKIEAKEESKKKEKVEAREEAKKKEKLEVISEKTKKSPKKETPVPTKRTRDTDKKEPVSRSRLVKEDPEAKHKLEVKIKQEVELKKERKKRKPMNNEEAAAASASAAALKLEEMIKDAGQFYFGGAASGAMAAAGLASEAAALKALEKEKPAHKRTPKKLKLKQEAAAADDSDSDAYTPSELEQELQTELQGFAMDLLEDNPSWERRKIIQNLVIWEFVPIDPALLPPQALLVNPVLPAPPVPKPVGRRKGKKMRKNQSGLDFAKKKTVGKSSRCVSRATTPDVTIPEEVHDVTYTLDHLLAETGRWVIDKSAGETILHRAAKMGYPDAAAYALDMAKMNPVLKDNAGIPPIHKAAFRGHADIVDYLLRYGADPNTNVKGTRPLHEALESGNLESVFHLLSHGSDPLLYDYSGNMPIDLAEENDEMLFYFSNLLNDLHGRKGARWNVSQKSDFIMPKNDIDTNDRSRSPDFEMELTNRLPPPFYIFSDREGRFVLSADFKKSTSVDVTSKNGSKLDVVEMSREDFLKLGRCGVLGVKPNQDILKRDKIVLVKLDTAAKRILDRADHQHS